MSVTFLIWFEIVKIILVLGLLILGITWATYGVLAEKERIRAFKGLQKGFHVEFKNVQNELDIDAVCDKINQQLRKLKEN
ncbi:hypothetical protein [Solibacillus sp. FSL K6-1523]|uniref:hypothetical protein n=1 Tax=Solibacillus sp. FSL K6-1523 TaxID=2921471 RepID=UPI0030FA05A8